MKKTLIVMMALLLCSSLSAEVFQKVVAKVGEDIITSWDIEEAVLMAKQTMTEEEANSPEGKARLADLGDNILKRMIEEKLVVLAGARGPEGFAEAAEDGKVLKNPFLPAETEVDAQLEKHFEQARSRFPTQASFEEGLENERMTVREYRKKLQDQVRVRLSYEKMIGIKQTEFRQSVRVSDDEAEAIYKEEKSNYVVADKVSLRHILFPANKELLALEVHKKLEEGANFNEMAEKHSKDEATRTRGGKLGWVEKGQLRLQELEKAAFAAKTGVVPAPVQTTDGWHVIRVDDRKEGFDQDFDSVKSSIKKDLYAQKINSRVRSWIDGLEKEFFVEILE